MMGYKYHLDNRTGKKKVVCPNCNRRSLTLYVGDDGNPLAPDVGRCDHEQSCCYHKTPGDYLREHPSLTQDWREWPDWLPRDGSGKKQQPTPTRSADAAGPPTFDTIPANIIRILHERCYDIECDFLIYLSTLFDDETMSRLVEDYQIGVTRAGDIVYPQIDINGNARTGHIMKYDRLTGHRIKDENCPDKVIWIHSECMKHGKFAGSFRLRQCLFGEHLLTVYPSKAVAVVESEKTALIASGVMPEYVWVSTAGINGLTADRLSVLKGRKIVLFPDAGKGFEKWSGEAVEFAASMALDITVSGLLERTATDAEKKDGIDIADRIVALIEHGGSRPVRDDAETPVLDGSTMGAIRDCISQEHRQEVISLALSLGLTATAVSSLDDTG